MTELEIEELERKVIGGDRVIPEETRIIKALPHHVGEDVRNVLPEMGAEEQADSLDEQEVALLWKLQKCWRRVGKISYQFSEISQ